MRRTRARAAWVAAPVPAGGSSVSIMVALQIISVSPPLLRCPQVHKASFSMLLLAAADAGGMGEVDHGWSRTHRHLLQPGLHHKAAALTGHDRRVQLSKRRGTTGLGRRGRTSASTLVFSVARSRFDLCSDWTISPSVCVHGGLPTLPQRQEDQREGFHIPGCI